MTRVKMIHYKALEMLHVQCKLLNEANHSNPMTTTDIMRITCPDCVTSLNAEVHRRAGGDTDTGMNIVRWDNETQRGYIDEKYVFTTYFDPGCGKYRVESHFWGFDVTGSYKTIETARLAAEVVAREAY